MSGAVPVVRSVAPLRAQVRAWRQAGETIALVPTMGALHRGHLELVRLARARCRRAVVSIFVNPTQFAPHEDFERYPRDEAGDLAKLADVGCDLVWAPGRSEMYAPDFATRVVPGGAAEGLESDFRAHFFAGVATVCCKLFTQVAPDVAVFGEKDYQQLCVVKQMVRDLDLPLEIVGMATVREPDGLALSSRNAYLSAEERRVAPALHRVIAQVAYSAARRADAPGAIADGKAALETAGFKVDYLEVRDAETLRPADPGSARPLRVLVAAWLGKTRLIDNVAV
ncbi:MAG TPA: pantoate--beta-alanine ligase [Hyphomicrobiaceae bacterium]|jgi:pantoate--beta-alanine ligase|nr:pantoate--beta-alanine ligase [Hyphomicrobiaceae bacterium]